MAIEFSDFCRSNFRLIMNRKRRPSNMDFDEQEAFRRACDYTITQEVFVTPELTKFIEVRLII